MKRGTPESQQQVSRARPRIPSRSRGLTPEVLTPWDLADYLDLPSDTSALDLIRNHGIPYVHVGKRKFILRESLVAFLKEREVTEPSPAEREREAERILETIMPRTREAKRKTP